MVDDSTMITLISSDNVNFQVPYSIMRISKVIEGIVGEDSDDGEASSSDEEEEKDMDNIPLPTIPSEIVKKIIDFCALYAKKPLLDIPKPLTALYFKCDCPSEYAAFVNCPEEQLYALVLAANYMDIQPLLEITCAKVADGIKGKTCKEIQSMFGIEGDLTPEVEAKVLEENPWLKNT